MKTEESGDKNATIPSVFSQIIVSLLRPPYIADTTLSLLTQTHYRFKNLLRFIEYI